jgi:hypothetical protein
MPNLYCDLYLPFPTPANLVNGQGGRSKKDKGKGKVVAPLAENLPDRPRSCWDGLAASERLEVSQMIGMAGHCKQRREAGTNSSRDSNYIAPFSVGCSIIACTLTPVTPGQIPPNPFLNSRPFPNVDPRNVASTSTSPQRIVQLSRLHVIIDDSIQHGFVSFRLVPLAGFR